MCEENFEINTKSLTDALPACNSTGTGTTTNQMYDENGETVDYHVSYDNSFQCEQPTTNMSLYVVSSGNGFSKFAKEKLVAEILFGQLSDNVHENVKNVLRRAFESLERDYLNWIDECITHEVQNMDQTRDNSEQATLQYFADEKTVYGIHIALALIYNSKLYTCNVGRCRVILCKTDETNDVLRAVQMSTSCENRSETTYPCASILSRLEIVGPIPLNDSHRFLVLMSSGLCRALQDIHNNEDQNINRELIQSIVHCFRIKSSINVVAQSVVEKIMSQHLAHFMQQTNNEKFKIRPDMTVMIRNFNYPIPNGMPTAPPRQNRNRVTFNPVDTDHPLSNNTLYSTDQSNNTYYTNSSTNTSTSNRSSTVDRNIRISPYVDFIEYYKNIEIAQKNGTLPLNIRFS